MKCLYNVFMYLIIYNKKMPNGWNFNTKYIFYYCSNCREKIMKVLQNGTYIDAIVDKDHQICNSYDLIVKSS